MDLSESTVAQVLIPVDDLDRAVAFYREVSDIHAVFEELTRRGVAFLGGPHVVHRTPEIEISLAEFCDPDGNLLALMAQSKAA